MKVLFVGEGPSDIGRGRYARRPEQPGGTLPALVKQIAGCDFEYVTIQWTALERLDFKRKKTGLDAKVTLAMLRAAMEGCGLVICVYDSDGQPERLCEMVSGIKDGRDAVVGGCKVICGLAINSIESWTLGAPQALATVLGLELSELRKHYPAKKIEELNDGSERPEYQPKKLLQRLADLKHRRPTAEFREEVAEITDISELEKNCPDGFKPFAARVRRHFVSPGHSTSE